MRLRKITKISDPLQPITCEYLFERADAHYYLGLGTAEVQAEDQSLRSLWLCQHRVCLTRRFSCCIGWQGRYHYALGPQRGQAFVLVGGRRHRQRSRLLAEPILALCGNCYLHQNLRPREQVRSRFFHYFLPQC